eukprot:403350253
MASKYLQKYPVPQGFPDILHDFAREVLRDQPDNIKEYGWQYFKAIEQGIPFEYKSKGKAIPPPKDRIPQHTDYHEIQPSHDAHLEKQLPKPKAKPQSPPQQQQQQHTQAAQAPISHQHHYQVQPQPTQHQHEPTHFQQQPAQAKLHLDEHKLKELEQQHQPTHGGMHKRDGSIGQRSQEEIDANQYVNNLMERVSKYSEHEEE